MWLLQGSAGWYLDGWKLVCFVTQFYYFLSFLGRGREVEWKRRRDEKDGAKPQVHSGSTDQNPLLQSTLKTEVFRYFLQISLLPGKGLLAIKPTGDKGLLVIKAYWWFTYEWVFHSRERAKLQEVTVSRERMVQGCLWLTEHFRKLCYHWFLKLHCSRLLQAGAPETT